MMTLAIPGSDDLNAEHLVLDYNGTLACDGVLAEGVASALTALAGSLRIHVVTADTFGRAGTSLLGLEVALHILEPEAQDEAKAAFIRDLGAHSVVAIGNGRNDRLMLTEAALGIALIGAEGASAQTLLAADVVCTDIGSALALLSRPLRLAATLRT